jgi:hypothetical protein
MRSAFSLRSMATRLGSMHYPRATEARKPDLHLFLAVNCAHGVAMMQAPLNCISDTEILENGRASEDSRGNC